MGVGWRERVRRPRPLAWLARTPSAGERIPPASGSVSTVPAGTTASNRISINRLVRPPLATLAALALAAAAATAWPASAPAAPAALPSAGILVPGRSLGGISLGMTKAQVRDRWGARFGRCRHCASETWYFTYRPFEPQGAGVVFRRGRVVQVFTIWQPEGWRTSKGLVLGAAEAEVTRLYGTLLRRRCIRYTAFVVSDRKVQTVVYVFDGEVWGFGLTQPGSSPCL
jgi:hypothetical protein